MDLNRTLLECVETLLAGSEFELVDLECVPGAKGGVTVRVFVDKDGGVGLDDCARLSRGLESHLETEAVIPGRYVLEVSSPGVDRPLRKVEDFDRFAGEEVRIATYERVEGGTKHAGILKGYDPESRCVSIERDGEAVSIPFDLIKKSHLKRDPWAEAKARAKS
jgi:ribosome maturation factor RimP